MPRTWASLFHATINESPDLDLFIKNLEESTRDIAYVILRMVGQEVVQYLKSYTSGSNMPRYRRTMGPDPQDPEFRVKLFKYQQNSQDPNRPRHPGGWSDITGDLRDSYYARTEQNDADWELVIGNRSEHAVFVEAKDGYFVVTGIMDPGGPVDLAIRKAFRRLAPTWKIQNMPGRIVQSGRDEGVQQSLFAYPTPGSGDGSLGGGG